MTPGRAVTLSAGGLVLTGAALLTYAVVVERHAFTVRHVSLPLLPVGSEDLRILHLSDLHARPGQRRKTAFVRSLADLQPDLVVATGDFVTFADSIDAALDALDPLLDVPGVFVRGNNDYFAPVPKNPLTYVQPSRTRPHGAELPWELLTDTLVMRGWEDLDNDRLEIRVAGRRIEFAGVDDTDLGRDAPASVAGPCDRTTDLRVALSHEPEPRLLDGFARDGFDLVLCGHTHGGQVRLPGVGAVVTNCGIDRAHARGMFEWQPGTWVNVSSGLGTSPFAPVRFLCRPDVTLLRLTAAHDSYTEPASGM